jgi:Flp pilus assembly pilin Flp
MTLRQGLLAALIALAMMFALSAILWVVAPR